MKSPTSNLKSPRSVSEAEEAEESIALESVWLQLRLVMP
jgi:hypothetical protein